MKKILPVSLILSLLFVTGCIPQSPTYDEIIEYVDANITEIINPAFTTKPANNKWFADGFGFTSQNHVYVDFEDGHYLYRALLECKKTPDSKISCEVLTIFKEPGDWEIVYGSDSEKENPIEYKWAKDYEWER